LAVSIQKIALSHRFRIEELIVIGRFQDKSVLVDALRTQKLLAGNEEAVQALATSTGLLELVEVDKGATIITQGADDNDLYLILSGALDIVVNGRKVATRGPGETAGEMAATIPHMRRSATVQASEVSVIGKLSANSLATLSSQFPSIWRQIAKILTERLYQRNNFVTTANSKLRIL
jgi:CRP/FNR family cyclic AMP-dependent transcriptional regulator